MVLEQHTTVQYNAMECSKEQCGTVQNSTVEYNGMPFSKVPEEVLSGDPAALLSTSSGTGTAQNIATKYRTQQYSTE